MKMTRKAITMFMLFLLPAVLASADPKADEIMRASFALPEARTMKSTMYMLLVDKNGTRNLRVLTMYSRQTPKGTDSYAEFTSPPDIKGTKFLTLATGNGSDDQRLWLPDLKKVRRIATSGKGASFVGSDLTYYDMERHHFADANYSYYGTDTVQFIRNGNRATEQCNVIDGVPTDPAAPYARTRVWVGDKDSFVYKSEMWNSNGELIKTIYIVEVKIVDGVEIPIKTAVITAGGHKTLLQMSNVVVNGPIDGSIFSIQNLER